MSLLTRRQFLSGAGLVVGASLIDGSVLLWGADDTAPAALNAWLRIAPDETVTILVAKSEMGQGVYTSLPMIVADELDADWERVKVEAAPADDRYKDPGFGLQATGGSSAVRHFRAILRAAGAGAREMLVEAAARKWGVPAAECQTAKGVVSHAKSGRSLSYGRLAAQAALLPVPAKPRLKEAREQDFVGKPWPRVDMADKVAGTARFGIDSFVPGMLYGALSRPHAWGAKPVSYDAAAAKAVPGVRGVVALESGVGVVADDLPAAWKGRDALKVQWGPGSRPDWDDAALDKALTQALASDGLSARADGDAVRALAGAAKTLEAEYRFPYLCHATMEPMNCTADVRADACEVWAPTQNQTGTQAAAAAISGLALDKVRVHTTYLGGGFGRRFEMDFVTEALLLSKAAKRPVKLVWTREDDMKNGFYRPASRCRVKGGLDAAGRLTAYQHKTAAASIFARVFPSMIRNGIDHSAVEGVSDMPYDIPNLKVDWVRLETPVPVGFWRSVGHSANAFAVEGFLDELAHAAGKDPLKFRLDLLGKDARSRRLLEFVADKAGWGTPLPPGRGRGLARHTSFGSAVATVAEASLDKKDGTITVHRVVCAADCGPVINLDTAKAQLEGATLMGLSAALKEALTFASGGVSSDNFDSYELLRMSEAPEVEAHLVESDGPLGGLGEPGVPPLAPAVANAVFAAAGVRLRRLPMTPESVLAELGG